MATTIPLNSTHIQQAGGAVLTTTAPAPLGATNVTGVATTAARADHVHAHGQQGGGLSHPLVTLTDRGFMAPDMLQRLNNSAELATTAPPGIATNSTTGTGASAARNDHTHAHGNQGGGASHTLATTSDNGFMSAADKAKLNAATAVNTPGVIGMRSSAGNFSADYFTSGAGGSLVGGYNIASRSLIANGGGLAFNVAVSGPSFTPTSDIRLKTDFANIRDDDALIRLMQIEPLEYTRLQDGLRARGFGAQGLRDIDPLYVVGDEPIFDEVMVDPEAGTVTKTPRLDNDGEQMRTPLGVDPVAILADVIAALRSHEVRIGSLELQAASAANPA